MKQTATFCVVDFGAVGDGITLNTSAIQSAFDACNAAGGGVVYFPPGKYVSGTLELRSNVTIYLENNAHLIMSKNMEDMPKPEPTCFVYTCGSFRVFLRGNRVENVAIRGDGVVDGQSALDILDGVPSRGPAMLLFENSRNICLENVEFRNSAGWCITFWGCQHVKALGIKVINSYADSIDPVCCQNVLIDGVYIEGSGDDAICIKNESVRHLYETRPDCGFLSENIIVSNVKVMGSPHKHPAVKIGTGTHGVFRNIIVHDCVFRDLGSVFCIDLMRPTMAETPERYIENVQLSNIIATNCKNLIDIAQMDVQESVIRKISMQNVMVENLERTSRIIGQEDAPIENLKIRQISFGKQQFAADSDLFSIEHVRNLHISDWDMDCEYATAIRLNHCSQVRVDKLYSQADAPLVTVEGEDSKEIIVDTIGYGKAKNALVIGEKVSAQEILPSVKRFSIERFEGNTCVKAGACISGCMKVRNEDGEGFLEAVIMAGGSAIGSIRTWLYRGEVKELMFTTQPIYVPGEYVLKACEKEFTVQVGQTPADIQVNSQVEVCVQEGQFVVRGSIFNAGGTKGEKEIVLKVGSEELDRVAIGLQPGERSAFALKTDRMLQAGESYEVKDLLHWNYQLAANTDAKFEANGNQIGITAAGKQYSASGDFEKSKLLDYGAVYTRIKGDFVATVKLISQDASGQYAFAGLIVCNDMQHAENGEGISIVSNSPKYGSMAMWRADSDSDGYTERLEYTSIGYGGMARIIKRGNVFQAFTKVAGQDWVECRKFEVPAATKEQDVGIFSYANSVKNKQGKAVFEDFTIEPLS